MLPSAANSPRRAFTLIEMMIVVVSMGVILTTAFEILGNVGLLSARVTNSVDANKDVYYAVEKLATYVKEGGKLDFEEYWNRSAFTASGFAPVNGHYPAITGFGNFGSGGVFGTGTFGDAPYLCRSAPKGWPAPADAATVMGSGGCLFGTASTAGDSRNAPQRFGQYRLQFVDYNSDAGSETGSSASAPASAWGDEDGANGVVGDDDDADLGTGPAAFAPFASGARELYLIKKFPQYERTYFRYVVRWDPFLTGSSFSPAAWHCDVQTGSGNACLGNVQMLKLVGRDLGYDHSGSGAGANDGKVDTWTCAPGFHCFQQIMGGKYEIPTGSDAEWVSLFPDYVNVKRLEFYPWPAKDGRYAWREDDPSITISPYVRIRITVGQSGQQRLMNRKSASAENSYSTTVSLSDF